MRDPTFIEFQATRLEGQAARDALDESEPGEVFDKEVTPHVYCGVLYIEERPVDGTVWFEVPTLERASLFATRRDAEFHLYVEATLNDGFAFWRAKQRNLSRRAEAEQELRSLYRDLNAEHA